MFITIIIFVERQENNRSQISGDSLLILYISDHIGEMLDEDLN